MGQVSMPTGLFGGSTLGGSTTPLGNSVSAVQNSQGKLVEYNPSTMSPVAKPTEQFRPGVENFLTTQAAAPSWARQTSTPQVVKAPPKTPIVRPTAPATPTAAGGTSSTGAAGTAAPATAAGAPPAAAAAAPKYNFNTATLDAMSNAQLSKIVNDIGMYGSLNNPQALGVGWTDIPAVHNYLADRLGSGLYTQTLAQGRMLMPPAGPSNNPSWWGGSNSS